MAGNRKSARFNGDLSAQLQVFADEVTEKALRNGGGAATEVLYDEMRARVPVGDTRILHDSIYRYRDKEASQDGRQRYFVGPNHRKAPHWHLLEYGHWMYYQVVFISGKFITLKKKPLSEPKFVPAEPFIRPTFDAKIRAALDAAKRRIAESVQEILRGK